MMLVARGVALQITGARADLRPRRLVRRAGQRLAVAHRHASAPTAFPTSSFPGIPYPVLLMIVLAIAVSFMLNRTGSAAISTRSARTRRRRGCPASTCAASPAFTYVLSGTLAGLTGCVLMSRLVTAQPNEGVMYELDAIASAVIGGTSLIGGVGTISGTVDRRLRDRHPAQRPEHERRLGLHPADHHRPRHPGHRLDRPVAQPPMNEAVRSLSADNARRGVPLAAQHVQ